MYCTGVEWTCKALDGRNQDSEDRHHEHEAEAIANGDQCVEAVFLDLVLHAPIITRCQPDASVYFENFSS